MNRDKSPLGQFLPPRPPQELKRRVLEAAEDAWGRRSMRVPEDRVRFGLWDWAWAAGLVLLLLANALVDGYAHRRIIPSAVTQQEQLGSAELARLGIVLPARHPAQAQPSNREDVDDLGGAAGADF
jgi:hypothetical protein